MYKAKSFEGILFQVIGKVNSSENQAKNYNFMINVLDILDCN